MLIDTGCGYMLVSSMDAYEKSYSIKISTWCCLGRSQENLPYYSIWKQTFSNNVHRKSVERNWNNKLFSPFNRKVSEIKV